HDWALTVGATVRWTPGLGLDGAVQAGVASAAAAGAHRIVVSHADLPLATGARHVVGHRGGALVPDPHSAGTNVITVPAHSGFRFAYGPGAFARHRAEATRLGLPVEVQADLELGWDVDVPSDLELPGGHHLSATGPTR